MKASHPIARRFASAGLGAALAGALGSALLPPGAARAEDIDLFTASSGEHYAPNLYVMIDNSANWDANLTDADGNDTSKRELEYRALKSVFLDSSLTPETIDDPVNLRAGFGLFSDGKNDGGMVWQAVEDVTQDYQDNTLAPLFEHMSDKNTLKSSNSPYALSFNEGYLYFGGDAPYAGKQEKDGERSSSNPYGYDPAAFQDDDTYASPAAGNCGKNYVVLIGNGEPDSGEDNEAEDKLGALGGVLGDDPIDLEEDFFESNWADEYARFMAKTDVAPDSRDGHEQNVRTYVIDVYAPTPDDKKPSNKFKGARAWMQSIAARGDGLYFAAHNEDDIKEALKQILDELFAVNDVFAASTLPVSVNVRGTNLNQVYMGVFRPNEMDRTRWQGNLKLYHLVKDDDLGTLYLADQNDERAQSQSTGFIRNTAVSYWTNQSGFWAFDPRGTSDEDPASDLPDGEVVEKGGVHQRIRDEYSEDSDGNFTGSPSETRTLLTTPASCGACALEAFETGHSGVDSDSLGVADAAAAETLVDWVYGDNNATDTDDPDTLSDAAIRPSVHGDVLHSQPAVVNYGDTDGDDTAEIYTYYGANDGIFHAIEGGKAADDGNELWGFIPPEFFGRLKHLRNRKEGKEYFADGAVGVYRHDENDDGKIDTSVAPDDQVILYITMRRGGRLLYALDVTDPHNPEYLWKLDPDEPGFSELGYTWSRPEVMQMRYEDDGATVVEDVLMFGGGYDPAADDDDQARSMGRALFVVDAMTGDLIWKAGQNTEDAPNHGYTVDDMSYSIPSDVAVIDGDQNGYADRMYVGDTGGQVWRADLGGPPADWHVYKLASDGEAATSAERKFLYPPDVVTGEDSRGRYKAVLLGSGDRTSPFKTSVLNRFYMFKDHNTDSIDEVDQPAAALVESDLYDATDGVHEVIDSDRLDGKDGWYINLRDTGEKVVTNAVTLGGTVFFSTNEPPPPDDGDNDCSKSLGTARSYQISFEDGTATNEENDGRSAEVVGGGFPPSPVHVMVEIDGDLEEAVVAPPEVKDTPGKALNRRNPAYWQSNID